MSITDSRTEREEAISRITAKTDEQLREDLAYWAVASADHLAEHRELVNRQHQVGELYGVEQAWVALITDEMRSRRTRKAKPA